MVMPKVEAKKTRLKRAPKEVIEETGEGDKKSLSSSEFNDIFDVNYTSHHKGVRGKRGGGGESFEGNGLTSFLTAVLQKIDNRRWSESMRGLASLGASAASVVWSGTKEVMDAT